MQQAGGIALFGLTAVAWFALRGIDGGIVMTVLSGSVCLVGAFGMFGRGTLQVLQSTKRLHAVSAMRQLPVARIRQLER